MHIVDPAKKDKGKAVYITQLAERIFVEAAARGNFPKTMNAEEVSGKLNEFFDCATYFADYVERYMKDKI